MDTCKYVHYEIDYKGTDFDPRYARKGKKQEEEDVGNQLLPKFATDEDYISRKMLPPQVGYSWYILFVVKSHPIYILLCSVDQL